MKSSTRLAIFFVMCFFFMGAIVTAQQTSTTPSDAKAAKPLPSLEAILEKYVQAVGGKVSIEKLTSQSRKGTFQQGEAQFPVEMYIKSPGKWAFVLQIPDGTQFRQFSNGKTGWIQDPGGIHEMPPDQLTAMNRNMDLQYGINLKKYYPKMVIKSQGASAGRDAILVEAKPTQGEPDLLYFDVENGRLLQMDSTMETPQGTFDTQTFFEDFREIDGVTIANTLRQTGAGNGWVIKFAETKHNGALEDSLFENTEAKKN
jgi:hypothetical protein